MQTFNDIASSEKCFSTKEYCKYMTIKQYNIKYIAYIIWVV